MEERHTTPDAGTFRDAVQHEDPRRWGTSSPRDSTLRGASGPYEDPNLRSDVHNAHMHPTSTATDEPLGSRRLDDAPATYVGTGPTPVVERTTDPVVRRTGGNRVETEAPVERRRFSIGATFLGWAVATFFSLLFLSMIAGALGGSALAQYYGGDTAVDGVDVAAYSIPALLGLLVATFLAWLIGGYAAGRIALWDGAKHGLAMIVWPIVFGLLGWLLGATLGDDFIRATGVNFDFNRIADFAPMALLGLLLTLGAMLAGGALGGRLGERYHDRVHGIDTRERRRTTGRRAL